MKTKFHLNFFWKYFFICFILHISLSNQKENSSNKNKDKNNIVNNNNYYKRKIDDSEYHPIKILIDESLIDSTQRDFPEIFHYALSNITEVFKDLIFVKDDLNGRKINLDLTKYPNLIRDEDKDKINSDIISGIEGYDAVIIMNSIWQAKDKVKILERSSINNRPILGYIELPMLTLMKEDLTKNINNLIYYLMQYIIQFLGFSYENFEYFNNTNIDEVYETVFEERMQLNTSYIKTPKVLEIAKKYFNCSSITGLPLENQNENELALWDARYLLGDLMSSRSINQKNFVDLVLSEFTLALLEDSGWYQIYYYTGGLMRFGKHKGCDFLNEICSPKFKNEFCDNEDDVDQFYYGSCSSGRQSLTYCSYYSTNYWGTLDYFNSYKGKGEKETDYCLVNEATFSEISSDFSVGNCKYEKNNNYYGSKISYMSRKSPRNAIIDLKEKYSSNSFCILSSMITESSNDDFNILSNGYIFPLCYEMFCSDRTLTIKISEQYITCPRQGGKVKLSREFKGHIFCPDYNLICTGTEMCNDMLDCMKKKSLIKEESFIYDYTIATSQIPSELKNSEELIGYEESINGICKINCSQCYFNKTCYKCREGLNFVGDYLGQSIDDIYCKEVSVNSGYYNYADIYYPCLTNCDVCTNASICLKCKYNYYFIGNDRTFCDTGKNLTLYFTNDTGISYFLCDSVFHHCETCENETTCTKCLGEYCFIGETKAKCELLPDKTEYFTEDGGISYLKCSNYIQNCLSCSSRNHCTKCFDTYYMIGDDRTNCVNNIIKNFSLFYVEDAQGPVYYPCDTHFKNCLTCMSRTKCTNCIENYIFIRQRQDECFIYEENKLYRENGYYYPCFDAFENCDECKSKGTCDKCFEKYYFTLDTKNNNKKICAQINITNYYLNEDGVYISCNSVMSNCEQCTSNRICTKCKSNFYFLKNDPSKCRNDLDLRKYYSLDNNISFIECAESINRCEFCSNGTVCEKCYNNFNLYKDTLNECINLGNLEYFYKKGISYFPCNESINMCNKCYAEDKCYECKNNLKLILNQQNYCYNDNVLLNNNSLIKLNETFYMKCSDGIEHCSTCYLNNAITNNVLDKLLCQKCENNYIFINECQKKCINVSDLKPDDEYIKINDMNYYTCDYAIPHCEKCESSTHCNSCLNEYTFADYDYSKCYKISDMSKGFYKINSSDTMYFSCLKNCDICTNGKECIQCKENFLSFEHNTICGVCNLNLDYTYKNLTEELIDDLAKEYINNYESDFTFVNFYLNIEKNFSITIFRSSQCTNLIFEKNNYMGMNLDELMEIISTRIFLPYIIINVNYNNKNILLLYTINPEGDNSKINILEICPECKDKNYLKIKNNFGIKLNEELSPNLVEEIIENEHNIFEQDDSVFNDICINFNIKKIDIPINERRKLFYLGKNKKEILCNDINCNIKNIFISNTTSYCECKIQTEFNYLFSNEDINNNIIEYNDFLEGKKKINSFLVFKCGKEAFDVDNIKNNAAFYISLILLIIQAVLFIIYILYKKSKPKTKNKKSKKKKIKSNPPRLDKIASFTISDDLDDENDNNNNIINTSKEFTNNYGDLEKQNQKKEFNEKNIIDYDSDDEGDDVQNIQEKDLDSLREREIENEIIELGGTVNEENLKIQKNKFKKSRNGEVLGKNKLNKEINKDKNKLNFLEEEDFEGDEAINDSEKNSKGKQRSNALYNIKSMQKKYLTNSKNSLISDDINEINEIQNDIYQKTEYIKFKDALKKKEVTFWEYYFKLIQLKQPILNLLSPIKKLKFEENNIPTLIKLMRFIFLTKLNIFFNIFHLDQNYFRKKYEHFNNKYNIITVLNMDNISTNEIFAYALGHAVLSGFISFIICLIIQSVINFFVFNLKKKLNELGLIMQKKKKINEQDKFNEIVLIMKKERKKYIIFFSIGFVVMILIFYLMINFNEVYRGGILDLIGGFFWTFIFLQIIPFIYCLIFAGIRYYGIKNKNEKMFYYSQIIFF